MSAASLRTICHSSRFSFQILVFSSLLLLSLPISASVDQFKLDGKVLDLDDSNFDAAISSFDYIFVDFYAPWCGHCKRISPELDKAAPILAGLKQPIVVAKVDADKYKKLASKHDIDGYPTLKIFIHGVPTEYYGPRKSDLLVRFLKKFVAPDVSILNSDSDIREFIDEAGTNFPLFIGFGVNESVILNLAVKYKKKAWFSVAKGFSDDIMTMHDFDKVPALAVFHNAFNEKQIFYGPFEEKFLEDYVKQSLFPLVLPINQDTLNSLKEDKRKIVLTILKDDNDENSMALLKLLKAAASANRELVFGYVGFKQWEDFVESFDVNEKTLLPRMVVWDGNEEYYSVIGSESLTETDMGTQISRFLEGYKEGNVTRKSFSGPTFMGFLKSQFGATFILFLVCLLLLIVLLLFMFKDEPPTVGTEDQAVNAKSSTNEPETRESRKTSVKED